MIIGSRLLYFENLPSTNTHASFLLKNSGLAEGTIVYTNYQLAGRGQSGNKWESEDGKNLLISIVLLPSFITPADQFLLSMTISLGICDFLGRYIPVSRIKWPNDIYVNNDKIAGLLIENSIMGNHIESTIAGIGLNVNQDIFKSDAPNPVSLKRIIKRDLDLSTCLNELASDIDLRYSQLLEENYNKIKEEYISKLFRLNTWSDYSDKNGIFTGRIITLSESGNLLVESQSGKTNEYSFKEVEFIL
jgi:BirA family transcriptional regulator, biotin operon repressor / biotin---[acetyl-CoA-carboxylase] ligase